MENKYNFPKTTNIFTRIVEKARKMRYELEKNKVFCVIEFEFTLNCYLILFDFWDKVKLS